MEKDPTIFSVFDADLKVRIKDALDQAKIDTINWVSSTGNHLGTQRNSKTIREAAEEQMTRQAHRPNRGQYLYMSTDDW